MSSYLPRSQNRDLGHPALVQLQIVRDLVAALRFQQQWLSNINNYVRRCLLRPRDEKIAVTTSLFLPFAVILMENWFLSLLF
jgi:hypothetical protein